jgi:gas vesicle protein
MAKKSKSGLPWAEIGSAAFAATVGGVLGMLFAPASGKKTRQALASEGKKLVTRSTKTVKRVTKEVEDVVAKQAKRLDAKAKTSASAVLAKAQAKPIKKAVRKTLAKSK